MASHLPSSLKIFLSPFIYLRNDDGDCLMFFSLINNKTKMIETKQMIGNAKKTEYQTINPNKEPKMGERTFPSPLEASKIPKTLLCSPPLNKSPVNAIAIGAVPAAPIPCKILPAIIHR